jgi:hypothetical protein
MVAASTSSTTQTTVTMVTATERKEKKKKKPLSAAKRAELMQKKKALVARRGRASEAFYARGSHGGLVFHDEVTKVSLPPSEHTRERGVTGGEGGFGVGAKEEGGKGEGATSSTFARIVATSATLQKRSTSNLHWVPYHHG